MTDKAPIPLEHVGTYDKRTHVAVPLADLLRLKRLIEEAQLEVATLRKEYTV